MKFGIAYHKRLWHYSYMNSTTRKPASIDNGKYKIENAHFQQFFYGKVEARKAAMAQSSWCTVVLCQRVTGGGWEMISRYRFGKVA